MNDEKKVLLGMSKFTAAQIAKWLYQQHVGAIDEMTNLSKANREKLNQSYQVGCMAPIDSQHSKDGTIKYLFPYIFPMATAPHSVCRARWAAR